MGRWMIGSVYRQMDDEMAGWLFGRQMGRWMDEWIDCGYR